MRPVPPPPPDEIDFRLLDRFLAGECSPAEAEVVRSWFASNEANAQYLSAVRDALQPADSAGAVPDDPDAGWARLARDTVDAERNADRLPPPLRLTVSTPRERRGLRGVLATPWLRVAATVVLVAGAGATAFLLTNNVDTPRSTLSLAEPTREYATARGERAELRLPDGTRVVLAPGSRLELSADFGVTERTVALTGQGYFDVKHGNKPFQVRANNAVARDLGTRFDVRAYPGADPVRVVVAEGKVQLASTVAAAGTGPVLGPGELGSVDAMGAVTTGRANLATALAWTRGELVFDDVPLRDVVIELARWYDFDFQVADSLLRRKRLTLTLGLESATEATEAVALLAGARYEQRGRTVTFIPLSSLPETGR